MILFRLIAKCDSCGKTVEYTADANRITHSASPSWDSQRGTHDAEPSDFEHEIPLPTGFMHNGPNEALCNECWVLHPDTGK